MEQTCDNPAVLRYTWPGQDEAVVCVEYAETVKAIADAMTFHLQFIPLDWRHLDLSKGIPTCQQKKSAK